MSDIVLPGSIEPARRGPNLDRGFNPLTAIIFMGVIAAGILFVAHEKYNDGPIMSLLSVRAKSSVG
jgi:inorganic phosphate transporter, PiT family